MHWFCEHRHAYSADSDIWDLHIYWPETKPYLQAQLLANDYVFSPMIEISPPDGKGGIEKRELWRAQDDLVSKAMAIVLEEHLDLVLSDRCFYIAGRGGFKAAVREAYANIGPERFVMKSDVKGYYANMDHHIPYDLMEQHVSDLSVLQLVWRYLNRTVCTVCYGENYRALARGVSLGCSMSPLMGARYLRPLVKRLVKNRAFLRPVYGRLGDYRADKMATAHKTVQVVKETLSA